MTEVIKGIKRINIRARMQSVIDAHQAIKETISGHAIKHEAEKKERYAKLDAERALKESQRKTANGLYADHYRDRARQ